MVFLAELNLTL